MLRSLTPLDKPATDNLI